jgi:sulfate transport system permease protein
MRPGLQKTPAWARWTLVAAALAVLTLLLILPLALVLIEALRPGWRAFVGALADADAMASLRLTFVAALVAVPLNTFFGLAAAWLIARKRFWGRDLLLGFIDLPFAISPVVSGLMLVLVFGRQGWLGPWLAEHGLQVVFTPLAVCLATVFITVPFVAREVLPVLEAQGTDEEDAAAVLGAGPWTVFWRVTLPNLRWALLFGVVLCTARALGEFGAVSVVSGHIRGVTNTLPLHVETLYNEYQTGAAFAGAAVLALLAVLSLLAKAFVTSRAEAAAARGSGSGMEDA